MKQIIVMISMVLLGLAIFEMIVGPGEDSIKSTTMKFYEYQVENQNTYP